MTAGLIVLLVVAGLVLLTLGLGIAAVAAFASRVLIGLLV